MSRREPTRVERVAGLVIAWSLMVFSFAAVLALIVALTVALIQGIFS